MLFLFVYASKCLHPETGIVQKLLRINLVITFSAQFSFMYDLRSFRTLKIQDFAGGNLHKLLICPTTKTYFLARMQVPRKVVKEEPQASSGAVSSEEAEGEKEQAGEDTKARRRTRRDS